MLGQQYQLTEMMKQQQNQQQQIHQQLPQSQPPLHGFQSNSAVGGVPHPSVILPISALNPRKLSNSYQTPPPVPTHAYQHVKMLQHQQRTTTTKPDQPTTTHHTTISPNSSSMHLQQQQLHSLSVDISPPPLTTASASQSTGGHDLPLGNESPASTVRSLTGTPQHHLQQEVLRLQAENASVKAEMQALRHRLKQIEEHNISIPPTMQVGHAPSTAYVSSLNHSPSSSFDIYDSHSQIATEQQALAAWQQSQALDMPLPLMKHVQAFDAEPFLRPTPPTSAPNTPSTPTNNTAVSVKLHSDIGALLEYLKPSKRSESRRANVLSFLKLLVRKSLGAQVYPLGAYALKTYVGQDEVMDVSAFFSRAHENTWLHRIVNALCQEASSNHHNSNNIHATNTTSPHYAVSKLSVSFNKTTPYINCCIGGIHCNIFGNHVAGLSSLALFERMDLICQQEHLFKRTIILVKCWCMSKKILNYASQTITPSSSGDDLFSHIPIEGLLSGMFIRTLVLYIFNSCSTSISTPLEGLYRLLHFLRDFDWDEHALTIYGAVTLNSLEQHGCQSPNKWEYVTSGATAWPTNTKPFLPVETWKQYLLTPKDTQPPPSASRTSTGGGVMPNRPLASSTSQSRSSTGTATPSNASSASAVTSPMLGSGARSNSDNSLASLTNRGAVQPSLNQQFGSPLKNINAMSPHLRAVNVHESNLRSSHSQSFSSLETLDNSQNQVNNNTNLHPNVNHTIHPSSSGPNISLRHSMHSHSYSNLSNLQQYSSPMLTDARLRERESSGIGMINETGLHNFDAFSPADSPSGSASLSPNHSQIDLQKLISGITGGNNNSNHNVGPRLGFGSGSTGPTPSATLRPSASMKQLNRLPQPVAASASSSSFFSSHVDDDEDSDGGDDAEPLTPPGFDFDDDETHGRVGAQHHLGSSNSLEDMMFSAGLGGGLTQGGGDDNGMIEGAEYLDIGGSNLNSPIAVGEDESNNYPSEHTPGSSPIPTQLSSDPHLFTRCSLNVLDPVDPTHNLGSTISYKHEYHIRKVLHEGFYALKNSIQKYAFQMAAKDQNEAEEDTTSTTSPSDRAVAELEIHPVILDLFEEAQLSRYKEQLHREYKHRKMVQGGNPPALPSNITRHGSASNVVTAPHHEPPTSLEQVFQSAPGPFSSSAFSINSTASAAESSSQGSLFAFDGPNPSKPVVTSPSRNSSFTLNPNSTHFVPNSTTATAPIIVDDMTPTPSLSNTASTLTSTVDSTATTASTSTVTSTPGPNGFDTLSGDFDKIVANLDHARQFETPDLTEDQLVYLIIDLLKERVSVPVGRMGSLLHDATNNHSLPAMLKEHYGGLKRLLERHTDIFQVGRDHPYNPNVSLKPKWYNFAPPRPIMHTVGGGSNPGGNGSLGMTSNGSSGNLQAMANGDGNNRRKLQRRRTRTRRTNSGAATIASTVAVQAVRANLLEQQQQHASPPHLQHQQQQHSSSTPSLQSHPRAAVTPIIALDCEMVGVGPSSLNSILARISIVNFAGEVLYDKFVLPTEPITDFRTAVSGILPHHLESGTEFRQVQREVSQIVKGRMLVGHGLMADLQALCIAIPKHQLRDTAVFKLFCPHRPLPLKQLVREHLSHHPDFHNFQEFQHNPIADARAALQLYKSVQTQWESLIMQEANLGHQQHSHSQPSISTMAIPPSPQNQQQQQQQFQSHLHSHSQFQQQSNQLQQVQQLQSSHSMRVDSSHHQQQQQSSSVNGLILSPYQQQQQLQQHSQPIHRQIQPQQPQHQQQQQQQPHSLSLHNNYSNSSSQAHLLQLDQLKTSSSYGDFQQQQLQQQQQQRQNHHHIYV